MPQASKRSLRSKLLLITVSIMLLISMVTLAAVAWTNSATESERLTDIEQQIRDSIQSRGATLTASHALALKSLVSDNAFSDVSDLVARAMDQKDVVYGAFIDSDGRAWAYVSPSTVKGARVEKGAWKELGISPEELEQEGDNTRSAVLFGQPIEEFRTRVKSEDGEALGTIVYGLSTQEMSQAVAAAGARSREALREALVTIGLAGALSLCVGILLISRAASQLTDPIVSLTTAANQIADGERGVRAEITSGDEVEVLAGAFNQMLQANEQAMERLEVSMQRALESDRLKSEFLANMSHEIRTPMNGVLGMVKLMQTLPLDNKLYRYVETIDASANALLTVINDILDFSKLEAGKYTIQSVPFQPKVVAQEVAELLASRAHDKDLELIYRTDPALPSFVIGDPDRLKQVLTNLVGNAVKFTDRGEVFINMTLASRDETEMTLRIAVHDTGIGIDEKDLPKLYEVFSQVDGSMVRKHGGTGLGLAICKRLLKMMGGDVQVTSELGVGSVFTFTVTVGVDERENVNSVRPVQPLSKSVLVVESSRWRDLIAEHLRIWGLSHEVLTRGSQVLERLLEAQKQGKAFDVVVLGTELTDTNVTQLVQSVRAQESLKDLPMIVLAKVGTNVGGADLERQAVTQLQKPIRFSELYNCLANSVESLRQATAEQLQPLVKTMRNKKVLVVDDNEVNQFVAAEQLEQLGYQVDVAENGLVALEKIKAGGFSAVLMDCQMPVMDGYTATREVRDWEAAQGDGRRIPIIALTAHALGGERERVLTAGMDDYLSKPCRASALEKLLQVYAHEVEMKKLSTGEAASSVKTDDDLDGEIQRSEKLIRLFLDRVPVQLSALGEAIEAQDVKEVRAHAHKLKGSSLALGATTMSTTAETLQKNAEKGELAGAEEYFMILQDSHERVEKRLAEELAGLALS